MNRREFLGFVGIGGLASSLPVAIAACSPQATQSPSPATSASPSASSASPAGAANEGFVAVGKVGDLDKAGFLQADVSGKSVLVVRDPGNKETLHAVDAQCTHKGCILKWKADEKHFECPCHDSDFAPDGKVLKGPADKPLPTYQPKLAGDQVLVKVS